MMDATNQIFVLLAQEQHPLAEASERFRQTKATFGMSDVIIGLALLLVTALGMLLLKKLLERSEKQSGYRHAGKLFDELCTAHGLSHRARRLLRRLAANQALDDPGRMFIEPERFDVSRIPESLAKRRDEVFALRDQLFAGNTEGEVSWLAPQVAAENQHDRAPGDEEALISF